MTGSITVLQKDETDQRKTIFAINQAAGWINTNGAALSGAIRYDIAQSLTGPQLAQARSNIYAAPFDALAYNGMQINGSMDVSQERGTGAATLNGQFIVDGFILAGAGTMGVSAAQVADAPPGLTNSIRITVATAEASLGTGDYISITQNIEGYRTSRLAFGTANAQSISIGFWSKIHRTGLYSGSVRNYAGPFRSFPFTFVQNVADTWQYNTITIPGDVTGTWAGNTNAGSFSIFFSMAAGSALMGTANTWTSASLIAATGTTNGVAATSDVFQITGVVVLPGIELPSASRSPLIMRPFTEELLICKRYFQKMACVVDTISAGQSIFLAPEMRANPTFTGGGAGFTVNSGSPVSPFVYQTARAVQTLSMDARL